MKLRTIFLSLRSFLYKLKARLNTALCVWACYGSGSVLAKSILRRMNLAMADIAELSEITSDESKLLAEASSYSVSAPRWIGRTTLTESGVFKPLFAHIFEKALVNVYSPAILCGEKLYLPKHLLDECFRVLTDSAGLFKMEPRYTVVRINPNSEIQRGILIGGAGAFNWYHFVLECLPKAFLAQQLPAEFDDFPLLVPDECRRIPSFASSLAIFSDSRALRYMHRGEYAFVDRLVILDEINIGPFNMAAGLWPRISDYRQHDILIRRFIEKFRSEILTSVAIKNRNRRIFLIRPGERRSYNQEELIKVASIYGFEKISLETLSLHEQARVFSETELVVGPSGAAWVGIIFQDQPLRGLSWLPKSYEQFCAYSTLGKLCGHKIDFIEANTQKELHSTGDAYTAEYSVCPRVFEDALKSLV